MKTGPALGVGKQAGAGMLKSNADALTGGVCTKIKRARVGKKSSGYPTCPKMLDKKYIIYLQAQNEMLKRRVKELGG